MTHEQAQELLLDLAYGELEPEAAAEVARHAAECATCGPELQRVTSTRALASALREDGPPPSGRAPLVEAARRAVAARPERRWFVRPATLSVGAAAAVALVVFGVTLQLTRPGAHPAGDEAGEPVSRAAGPSAAARPEVAAPAQAPRPELPTPDAAAAAPAAPSPRTATPRQRVPERAPRPAVAAEPPAPRAEAAAEAAAGPAARSEASAAPAAAPPPAAAAPAADAQRAPASMRMRSAAKAQAGAGAATSGPRAETGFPAQASFTSDGFVYRAREVGSESGPTLVIEKLRLGGEPVSSWRVEALEGGRALAAASGGDFRALRWSDGVLRFTLHRAERVLACSVSGVETGAPAVTCAPAAP